MLAVEGRSCKANMPSRSGKGPITTEVTYASQKDGGWWYVSPGNAAPWDMHKNYNIIVAHGSFEKYLFLSVLQAKFLFSEHANEFMNSFNELMRKNTFPYLFTNDTEGSLLNYSREDMKSVTSKEVCRSH